MTVISSCLVVFCREVSVIRANTTEQAVGIIMRITSAMYIHRHDSHQRAVREKSREPQAAGSWTVHRHTHGLDGDWWKRRQNEPHWGVARGH